MKAHLTVTALLERIAYGLEKGHLSDIAASGVKELTEDHGRFDMFSDAQCEIRSLRRQLRDFLDSNWLNAYPFQAELMKRDGVDGMWMSPDEWNRLQEWFREIR